MYLASWRITQVCVLEHFSWLFRTNEIYCVLSNHAKVPPEHTQRMFENYRNLTVHHSICLFELTFPLSVMKSKPLIQWTLGKAHIPVQGWAGWSKYIKHEWTYWELSVWNPGSQLFSKNSTGNILQEVLQENNNNKKNNRTAIKQIWCTYYIFFWHLTKLVNCVVSEMGPHVWESMTFSTFYIVFLLCSVFSGVK